MTLVERLRRNALKNGGGASHELHKAAHEAADAINAHLTRILELEAVLRPIIEWHDTPIGPDRRFSECAKELDALIDRAREVL